MLSGSTLRRARVRSTPVTDPSETFWTPERRQAGSGTADIRKSAFAHHLRTHGGRQRPRLLTAKHPTRYRATLAGVARSIFRDVDRPASGTGRPSSALCLAMTQERVNVSEETFAVQAAERRRFGSRTPLRIDWSRLCARRLLWSPSRETETRVSDAHCARRA